MMTELVRLAVGLLIAIFHQPLSDFILEQDRAFIAVARSRGLSLPPALSAKTGRNLYFSIGILVALYELLRIWTLLK